MTPEPVRPVASKATSAGGSTGSAVSGGAVVYAKDLPRVSRFYAEVCGMVEVLRGDGFVAFQKSALELVVLAIPRHIAEHIAVAEPALRREDTALKLMFVVDSIAAVRAMARELGGAIDPAEREWIFRGLRVCDGHDPEGNVIQLRERTPHERGATEAR